MGRPAQAYLSEYPHLVGEWDVEKNGGVDPNTVPHKRNKRAWWVCSEGHSYEALISDRTEGKGCPFCAGQRPILGETDLATTHPNLVTSWSPENTLKPHEVSAGSNKQVFWRCSRNHEWRASVNKRVDGRGCPYCSGRRVLRGFNDLTTTHQNLAQEWSDRNEFGPETVSAGSDKKVYWCCSLGHVYMARVANRLHGTSCPYCANQKVLRGFNDLTTTHPELAAEWSPKNEFGPESVVAKSNKRVLWVCATCAHEWGTTPNNRVSGGTGCPRCCLKHTSLIEGELYRRLSECFPDASQGARVGEWGVDILLTSVRVIVEYDGSYFHKDRVKQDVRKTVDLLGKGYRVVRVREKTRQYSLPNLAIDDTQCLELVYAYVPDWVGLQDLVNKITQWIRT